MQPMNSSKIYSQACIDRKSGAIKKHGDRFLYGTYVNLVRTTFCELVIARQSDLITELCKQNGILFNANNFMCSRYGGQPDMRGLNYDLFLILMGLDALLKGHLPDFMDIFDNVSAYLFRGMAPKGTKDSIKGRMIELLQEIDLELGRINGTAQAELRRGGSEHLPPGSPYPQQPLPQADLDEPYKKLKEKEQELQQIHQYLVDKEQRLNELQKTLTLQNQDLEAQTAKQEVQPPKSATRVEAIRQAEQNLRTFSQARQAEDSRLLGQLQKLQAAMQEGLQEIMRTREDIEYAAMQEAISQLLQLHELLWEILQYHPGSNGETDYRNLVDSCGDLQENIVQALAMLGVEPIAGSGGPYDPAYHQTRQRTPVARDAVVRSVVKPGFQYKKKVLEKALVEV